MAEICRDTFLFGKEMVPGFLLQFAMVDGHGVIGGNVHGVFRNRRASAVTFKCE